MGQKQMQVIECDDCHSIQKAEKATYYRLDGELHLFGLYNNQPLHELVGKPTRIGPQADMEPTYLCQRCFHLRLNKAEAKFPYLGDH